MPAHEPTEQTRAQVESLATFGIKADEIGKFIGVTAKTLRRHYRKELDTAHIAANAKVANALFKQAVEKGNVAAQIFWLKTRARWREVDDPLEGGTEEPTKVVVSIEDARKRSNK